MNVNDRLLGELGVSVVDAAVVEQEVLGQVKAAKAGELNSKLREIESDISTQKRQLKQLCKVIPKLKKKQKHNNTESLRNELKQSLSLQKQHVISISKLARQKTQIEAQLQFVDDTITLPNQESIQSPIDTNDSCAAVESVSQNPQNCDDSNVQTWICNRCTLVNDSASVHCSVCDTIKPRNPTKSSRKRSFSQRDSDDTSTQNSVETLNRADDGSPTQKKRRYNNANIEIDNTNIEIDNANIEIDNDSDSDSDSVVDCDSESSDDSDTNNDLSVISDAPSMSLSKHKKRRARLQKSKSVSASPLIDVCYQPSMHQCDDADETVFTQRINAYKALKAVFTKIRMDESQKDRFNLETDISCSFYNDEAGNTDYYPKSSTDHDHSTSDQHSLAMPIWLHKQLFRYQRHGVQWLWHIFRQQVGGLLGDEMGLGKTIQIISFLECLRRKKLGGAVLIVCPASVLQQWMREFHTWAPEMRVLLLHDSGQHSCDDATLIDILLNACEIDDDTNPDSNLSYCGCVIITTYTSLKIKESYLLPVEWGIVILDEGHKIRNPDVQITLTCKSLLTRHRIILSGAPLQNSLRDLWSLFDFIFPGRLGTLPVFDTEFVVPIKLGGYNHATTAQVEQAISCANILKSIIDPYILRRSKQDVKDHFSIPTKTEQVLFCKLTPRQVSEYRKALKSPDMKLVLSRRKGMTFKMINLLRKICNHPDLLYEDYSTAEGYYSKYRPHDYGAVERSGKLQVIQVILEQWFNQKHKALVFCQTRQFLNIVEQFVRHTGYTYRRLDGTTVVRKRQSLITEFNTDPNIFALLITTRAGGLGINLTGANRVLLVDPDWNPSTDSQARERAYRIGQSRNVVIYRLIVRGTIEEKVYHRQIYKTFLTDKVLKDPYHQRLFCEKDLRDLFSLDPDVVMEAHNTAIPQTSAAAAAPDISRNGINNESSDMNLLSQTDVLFGHLNASITPKQISNDTSTSTASASVKLSNQNDNDCMSAISAVASIAPSSNATIVSNTTNNADTESKENETILKLLFSRKGIRSAFRHDRIENIDNWDRDEIERFASKVAANALAALEKSRTDQSQPVNIPTWTGKSGFASNHSHSMSAATTIPRFGANHHDLIHVIRATIDDNNTHPLQQPSNNTHLTSSVNEASMVSAPSAPPSSASILAQIRARKAESQIKRTRTATEVSALESKREEKKFERLVRDLFTFVLNAMPNGVESAALIQHFQSRLENDSEQYVFRIVLQKMCRLVKRKEMSNDRKGNPKMIRHRFWILKNKYTQLSSQNDQ